jgi:hypothetical protein
MAVIERPEDLLAAAAERDACRARIAAARLTSPRLLETVLTQGQLAVEPGRVRPAGIDAIAELDRAVVELTGTERLDDQPTSDAPLVTGWELLTVGSPEDLIGATTAVPARPWFLALIAFADECRRGRAARRLTAAVSDGRFATALLRLRPDGEDSEVLDARVTSDLADLGDASTLAWGLASALHSSVRIA